MRQQDTKIEPSTSPLMRLRVEASPIAFVGAVLLVASEAFIGHTATVEPRFVILASDAGHLVAAGLWEAGAVMLAATIGRRHRLGQPLDARLLATRFSGVAAWSLAVVAVTGTALAWGILDGVGDLWTTTFGKVLVAKVAVVAAIALIGAYNHKVLVPALVDGHDEAVGAGNSIGLSGGSCGAGWP
jgi:copper transport protein